MIKNYDYSLEKELGKTPDISLGKIDFLPDEAILSPKDIAELLGRSNETIRRWCREGKLEAFGSGGYYMIKGWQFKEFLCKSHTRNKQYQRMFKK